jgi:putative FmdB family regulatory protein
MPLYEYQCRRCGPFSDWRPLAESSSPRLCPGCRRLAPRILSAPAVLRGAAPGPGSTPEPRLVRREPRRKRHPPHRAGRPWMLGH